MARKKVAQVLLVETFCAQPVYHNSLIDSSRCYINVHVITVLMPDCIEDVECENI